MKGCIETARSIDIRMVTVAPYFVSKLSILAEYYDFRILGRSKLISSTVTYPPPETPLLTADFVHPNPKMGYAKLEDVIAAFVGSITDTDEKTNFTSWLIPDDKGVYRMETAGYL